MREREKERKRRMQELSHQIPYYQRQIVPIVIVFLSVCIKSHHKPSKKSEHKATKVSLSP